MASAGNHRQLGLNCHGMGLEEGLSEACNNIQVNIKFGDGRSFSVSIGFDQTIGEIKEIVGKETGLASRSINLVFAGQLLKDNRSVEDCGLGGHTTLHAFCWSDDGLRGFDNTLHHEAHPSSTSTFSPGDSNENGAGSTSSLNSNNAASSSNKMLEFSRFFVFCKLCNCVRPGLLRVSCKLCGSGLFILIYGPSCWNDITSNSSLKGRCQNEKCTSDIPRFYLRCSQRHQGVEEEGPAAALSHVQSNCRRVECITCQDIASHVLIFPCPPGHVMCLDCFRQYAISSLEERQFVEHEVHGYTLPCPARCEGAFIEDSHHFLLMGPYKYERFKNFGAEEFVLQNGGVLCPAPNCGTGIFPDDDDRLIKCVECKFESCRECKREYHMDSCQESLLSEIHNPSNLPMDRERAQRASWESQTLNLIGAISKPCPGCATKTERSGGCMHMVCTRCGAEWCWLCVKPWDRECQALHWFG